MSTPTKTHQLDLGRAGCAVVRLTFAPDEIAAAILKLLAVESSELARNHFLNHFTLERHLASLAAALRSVETQAVK